MNEYRDIEPARGPAHSQAPAGRNVVAVIGIDRYAHWKHLRNAVNDAHCVRDTFRQLGFTEAVGSLFDGAATRLAIDGLLDELDETLTPLDSLVVFFAGHGWSHTQDIGGAPVTTGYLIPADGADASSRTARWIELDSLLRTISKLPPLHILVILDACYAGSALSGVIGSRGSGAHHSPFEALHKRMSRVVIASSLDDEAARDGGPEPGHSLFTSCLIDALRGGMPGIEIGDGRRIVHGSDLGRYVQHAVQSYRGDSGCRQTPDVGGFGLHKRGEMPIPLLPDDDARVIPEPPRTFAAGSVPTMPMVDDAALVASEPAFATTVRRRATTAMPLQAPPDDASDAAPIAEPAGRRAGYGPRQALAVAACAVLAVGSPVAVRAVRDRPPPAAVATLELAELAAVREIAERTTRFEAAVPVPPAEPARGTHASTSAGSAPPTTNAPTSPGTTGARRRSDNQIAQGPVAIPPTAPAPPAACFADVSSSPTDAEIVHNGTVIGKTHRGLRLALPCGVEVALSFQKQYYSTTTKLFIPTPAGTHVATRLSRVLYAMNVWSTPPGAAISLGGKPFGMTPMMVKIPAGETATVVISKDGYAPVSQTFTPAAGGTVSATLKKSRRSP